MSESPQVAASCHTPPNRWQIPLLGLGVLLLAAGITRLAAAYHPVTFEDELGRVALLREVGALQRANAYLLDLLRDARRSPDQKAELHRLLAAAIHQAEAPLAEHPKGNSRAIITNFQEALHYGVRPSADEWAAMADAYLWLGDTADAASAYREALRLSPERADGIRRQIIELHLENGEALDAASVADLNAILENPDALPANYLWAVDQKVEWLLAQGDAAKATAAVAEARERLSGTEEKLALTYTEALCLCGGGSRYSAEAEALLRSLLNEWTVRDRLWGEASWLLGRLQQLDGRPQAGLSFHEEVLRCFTAGDLHDACLLGRAECLAALERYDAALEGFAGLKDKLSAGRRQPRLDRAAARATVTAIGESLLQAGALELGVEYLRLALSLADEADIKTRVYYRSRIAGGLTGLAREAETAAPQRPADDNRAKQLRAEAGEMYAALWREQSTDEEQAAAALLDAVDSFDAAGMTERVVEVLAEFIRRRPPGEERAWVLRRLAQAHQALEEYSEAAEAYQKTIENYPRLLEAQASIVPLAECRLALGGEDARRGAEMLIGIVDDFGPEHLFDPQAREYCSALFLLADYYCRASEEEVPGHLEKAIARLEEAIALYPDDPQIVRLTFQLADAYQQSGTALAALAEKPPDDAGVREGILAPAETDDAGKAALNAEKDARLERALSGFDRVIAALAPRDEAELSEIERTYLLASYVHRGDCLFDLGRYQEALPAYNEAVWRYEDTPEAVAASMQIVHCHERLEQFDEARAALQRLSWLLRKMPASVFDEARGVPPKTYWENLVDRWQRTGVY